MSNHGKHINILTGQASCTVGYPMSCCMISKYKLNTPPAWFMRLFLHRVIMAAATKTALSRGEMFTVCDLPDRVVDLIGDLGGHPVTPDAPHCVGELSFLNSNQKWYELTRGGWHRLTHAKHKW